MPDRDKLLILDLDDTLFHASELPLAAPHQFEAFDYFVYVRPYAREFVARCFDLFTVAVWTTAVETYAEHMIEEIFPEDAPLAFLWDRTRCGTTYDPTARARVYIKELANAARWGWSLDRMVIVDDTPETARNNYQNLLPVESFRGDSKDNELKRLAAYLPDVAACDDVRSLDLRNWRRSVQK